MASRRPAYLDGSNAGLFAAIVAVPLLVLAVWVGPLRGFVNRATEEQARQQADIERLIQRKRTLSPIAGSERERVDGALTQFEADVPVLGEHPSARLVQTMATLLEGAGVHDVHVTVPPTSPGQEPRSALVIAAIDGSRTMSLIPNAVHVSLRGDFSGLRSALDALRDPGRTIQIESAEFARDGSNVKATLELTYWSRGSAK